MCKLRLLTTQNSIFVLHTEAKILWFLFRPATYITKQTQGIVIWPYGSLNIRLNWRVHYINVVTSTKRGTSPQAVRKHTFQSSSQAHFSTYDAINVAKYNTNVLKEIAWKNTDLWNQNLYSSHYRMAHVLCFHWYLKRLISQFFFQHWIYSTF